MPSRGGRFVWNEYTAPDPERAANFYGRICGWTFQDFPMPGGGTYKVARVGETPVAGFKKGAGPADTPSRWLSYLQVPDVDRACGLAVRMNGSVLQAPMDIPGEGRFALIRDPAGGVLAPFKPLHPGPESADPPKAGEFCWHHLQARDPASVAPFYAELAGWKIAEHPGPGGTYLLCRRGEREVAGIMRPGDGRPRPAEWRRYVEVDDVDRAAEIGQRMEGRLKVAPKDLPGLGRVAVLQDPYGGTIALFKWTPLADG